ncbi:MAG: 4Fe-4S binding protein [Syntrophomonadaceae bacterium]|jgi:epoxyqueuosine reductase QueG|nr:4Fe-4S binding protein [Syntrophomonadaceae bacterium]MDH7497363.1 4Fe-4S binding protein [Syntrophomonadaceae bacterium]
MKQRIREYALSLGVDDVGFAAAADYHSPRSPRLETVMPAVKSLVVLAYKELSSCDSPSPQLRMHGRLDLMEFSRSCNYKLARFIEGRFGARCMTVAVSYPLDMGGEAMGTVADVSLRHAALAAGLGAMGRHNLVMHPRFGSRVLFSAVLTDLEMDSDPPFTGDLCIDCDICVEACPGGALDQEGFTDPNRCLRHSQPYGIGAAMRFWQQALSSPPEGQKKLLYSEEFMRLYQAQFIGFQYHCFKCMTTCPVGSDI